MAAVISSILGPQRFMQLMSAIGTAKKIAGQICSATWGLIKTVCITLYNIISVPFMIAYNYVGAPFYRVVCLPGGCIYHIKECCCGVLSCCDENVNPHKRPAAYGRAGGTSETSTLLP